MNLEDLQAKYPEYHLEDRSVAIASLPLWVWGLTLVLAAVPMVLFAILSSVPAFDLSWYWLGFTLILLLLHEGTHALAWKYASGLPWSSFTFGVQWKTATPYCHSTAPMLVQPYRIGAIMPLIVTGILPWLVSLLMGNAELAMASAILISGAAGDLYILWSIKDLPREVLLQDHNTQAGCIALWPAGMTPAPPQQR